MESLRHIREQAGYSQQDLADETGVSQHTISEIELGRRKPQGRTLRKLAKALNVKVADLVGGDVRPKARTLSPRDAEPETALTHEVVLFEASYSSANFDEVMDEAREVIRGARSLHVPEGMHHLALLIGDDKVEVRAKPSASPASRTRQGRRATTTARTNRETA